MSNLQEILNSAQNKIKFAVNLLELQKIKIEFLGKKSFINKAIKDLSHKTKQERKKVGQILNVFKEKIIHLLQVKQKNIEIFLLNEHLIKQKTDLTIPVRKYKKGGIHPITQVIEEIITIFFKLGFNIKYGPTIENEWHNFSALNFNETHPARQMHDTFYLKKKQCKLSLLLRTHTSTIQIREMQNNKPPFRFIAPGRTYRSDYDTTHTPMFHQIEGLVVDKEINMGHLKYTITKLIKDFFNDTNIMIRFRPSFFPFTEPSAEVDIKIKKNNQWLEVLGCGMIHPNVFRNVNIDNNLYQGFAFGLGVERFAMLKYKINDLRQFFEGDIRWLKYYNFSAFNVPMSF